MTTNTDAGCDPRTESPPDEPPDHFEGWGYDAEDSRYGDERGDVEPPDEPEPSEYDYWVGSHGASFDGPRLGAGARW
jgi:hypothetical protein